MMSSFTVDLFLRRLGGVLLVFLEVFLGIRLSNGFKVMSEYTTEDFRRLVDYAVRSNVVRNINSREQGGIFHESDKRDIALVCNRLETWSDRRSKPSDPRVGIR